MFQILKKQILCLEICRRFWKVCLKVLRFSTMVMKYVAFCQIWQSQFDLWSNFVCDEANFARLKSHQFGQVRQGESSVNLLTISKSFRKTPRSHKSLSGIGGRVRQAKAPRVISGWMGPSPLRKEGVMLTASWGSSVQPAGGGGEDCGDPREFWPGEKLGI